ncbi:MAG: hypothetical protein E6R04_00650 [Spirochaetes bacterium]|nr:MAG: hypothetical protein E6R04_00650 [Spirochaetota bacterium]
MTDKELFDVIFAGIHTYKTRHYEDMDKKGEERHPYHFPFEAYVELAKDITNGNGESFQAGTKFRVRLASNMGDLCLSRNFKDENGYELRIRPGEGLLTNCHIVSMGKI